MTKRSLTSRLLRDQSGASAIEYGLILAGISIGIITAAQGLALGTGSIWSTVSSAMTAAIGGSSS